MAAVVEILYLAYKGDKEVTWSEACTSYGGFCSRLKLALALHALALCCFFVLAVISAYRAFSMFEPPIPPKGVEDERGTQNDTLLLFFSSVFCIYLYALSIACFCGIILFGLEKEKIRCGSLYIIICIYFIQLFISLYTVDGIHVIFVEQQTSALFG